jgi:hypothetical protein
LSDINKKAKQRNGFQALDDWCSILDPLEKLTNLTMKWENAK